MHFKPYSSEPNARRMPDDLAEELVRTLNEARTQRKALEAKRNEAGGHARAVRSRHPALSAS